MAEGTERAAVAGGEERRERYRYVLAIQTRWMDNDLYGHVNNVVYYSYFDTLINRYLIEEGDLDIHAGPVIAYAVETHCAFRRTLAYPEPIDGGLRVATLGRTSVRYELGLFGRADDAPAATGYFVHVFVDRQERRPTPIVGRLRDALERLRLDV